ncbi:hypothetical protein KKF86_09405 [bacterium]|nr:hypothetical protein [bacterium]
MFNKLFLTLALTTLIITISCKSNPTTSENTAPTALFIINPTSGTTITTFTFDASGSSDNEDATDVLQVRWDWNNDGVWDTDYSTAKTATHQYDIAGTYTIVLEVMDSEGLTNTITKTVTVSIANTGPTASFTVNPAIGTVNTIFNFDASGSSDNEDATDVLQVRWDWNNDGTYDTNYSTTKTTTHQYTIEGSYTVKLEVKDSEGWVHNTTTIVTVQRPSTVVTFSDASFEALIRVTLNKPTGDITDINLETITALNGNGWNVSNISGIEYCINLLNLDLRDNSIIDISSLSGFRYLQVLSLGGNQIVDISSLSGLINLILLYLDDNQIININFLSSLINLKELGLGGNQIIDIYPLTQNSGIDNGDIVDLTNNPLSTTSINTYIPQLETRGVTVYH